MCLIVDKSPSRKALCYLADVKMSVAVTTRQLWLSIASYLFTFNQGVRVSWKTGKIKNVLSRIYYSRSENITVQLTALMK